MFNKIWLVAALISFLFCSRSLAQGNIGIGTTTPQHPLTFTTGNGDKISLSGGSINPTTNHFGIGIRGPLLQLYTPTNGDDIIFGVGRSSLLTENFRFTGDGNLGIRTANPDFPLTLVATGNGIVHKSGSVTIGTYNNGTDAYIQTYTNHDLHFATNNAFPQMTLNTFGNVGIGTTLPETKLHVQGSVRIADGTQGVGKILVSDASGSASWEKKTGYGFYADWGSSVPGQGNDPDYIFKFFEKYDDGNNYNTATGIYTVPANGFYHFEVSMEISPFSFSEESYYLFIRKSGSVLAMVRQAFGVTNQHHVLVCTINTWLTAGDQINVNPWIRTDANITNTASATTHFSGFKVY